MPEAAKPQVASPPEKSREVREVWRSQTCARSRLSLLPFFGEAKKTRSPEEDEFLRSKNETFARRIRFNEVKTRPSSRGLVFTQLNECPRRHEAQRETGKE